MVTTSIGCPSGKKVIGGGVSQESATKFTVVASWPSNEQTWAVVITTSAATAGTAYAICATAS
jgi:hypothetical protein